MLFCAITVIPTIYVIGGSFSIFPLSASTNLRSGQRCRPKLASGVIKNIEIFLAYVSLCNYLYGTFACGFLKHGTTAYQKSYNALCEASSFWSQYIWILSAISSDALQQLRHKVCPNCANSQLLMPSQLGDDVRAGIDAAIRVHAMLFQSSIKDFKITFNM